MRHGAPCYSTALARFLLQSFRLNPGAAAEVMNKITPADISDPEEVITRAKALSVELGTRER